MSPLFLRCGHSVNVKVVLNRFTCLCADSVFCPKKRDKLTMNRQCFTEKEPHATKPPFLKVK
jgi:hypothetical protein